jgi:hypothetical protein
MCQLEVLANVIEEWVGRLQLPIFGYLCATGNTARSRRNPSSTMKLGCGAVGIVFQDSHGLVARRRWSVEVESGRVW